MKKKFFTLLLAVASAFSFAVEAETSIEFGYAVYTLDETTYTAVLEYAYQFPGGELVIPEEITYDGHAYTVTKINYPGFKDHSDLTAVTIPGTVTSIGGAFDGCNLSSVVIPSSVNNMSITAFNNNPNLTEVTILSNAFLSRNFTSSSSVKEYFGDQVTTYIIGDEVETIGNWAFSDCTGITQITLPEGLTTIGAAAFDGCTGITQITLPEGLTTIGSYAFNGCSALTAVTIPGDVTSIGDHAFSGCSSLASVTFQNDLTTINGSTFSGCSALTEITLPEGLTTIGDLAFFGCSALTTAAIPTGVTTIGTEAFYGCNLSSVEISSAVTSIGTQAFDNNPNLTTVTINSNAFLSQNYPNCGGKFGDQVTTYIIGDDVETIDQSAFYGLQNLTSVTFGSGLTTIGMEAFNGCNLSSVVIPASVTTLGSNAFASNTNLTTVTINSNAFLSQTFTSSSNVKQYFGDQVTTYIIGDEVKGIGKYAFYNLPNITSVTLGSGVETIGEYAFYSCTGLAQITFSDHLTTIGNQAFRYCSALQEIELPDALTTLNPYAFDNCTNLQSVTFGDGLTTIGTYAFNGCTSLETVTFGDGLTTIGNSAFSSCSSLETIDLPEGLTTIGGWVFTGCNLSSVVIPASVTTLGPAAFASNTNLTTVTINSNAFLSQNFSSSANVKQYFGDQVTSYIIGDEVTSIGAYAFYGLENITSVTMGDGLTTIGERAFYQCAALTTAAIPDNVTTIEMEAFYGCNLSSVVIPASVTTLGSNAFASNTNLTTVTINSNAFLSQNFSSSANVKQYFGDQVTSYIIGDEVTSIGAYAFNGCTGTSFEFAGDFDSIGEYAFRFCTGLTEVGFSDALTTLPLCAFNGCTSLETVTFGDGLTDIGEYAFYNCPNLVEFTLPEGLETIGEYAFYGCAISSVVIPSSVVSVGQYAFIYNGNLTTVTINSNAFLSQNFSSSSNVKQYFGDQVTTYIIGDEVTSIGAYAFYGLENLTSLTMGSALKTIGEYAFYNCPNLVEFTLPEGLETIGEYAFYGCAISSVVIPSSVVSVGQYAFIYNGNLTTVTINSQDVLGADHTDDGSSMENLFGSQVTHYIVGDEVTSIGAYTFYEHSSMTELTLGSGLKTIGAYAFKSCYNLTELTIPDNVDTIAENAFRGCYGLTAVDLGKGVKSIGYSAFYGCSYLPSIIIGPAVTELEQAFGSCTNLTTVTINSDSVVNAASLKYKFGEQVTHYILGDSVKAVPASLFNGYSNLTSVTLGKNIKSIGNVAFYNCGKLTAVAVPASVASIGNKAFYDCRQLASLSLSEGLETIGFEAFKNCDNLTTVVLPNSVTSIGSSVFSYCDNLTTFTFGSGVTEIGEMALANCPNLATVYNNATTPQEVSTGTYQLGNYSNWDLYVPCTTHDLYAAAEGWSECKSITEFGCATYTITWLNDDSTLIETTECGQGAIPTHAPVTKEATAQYTYTFVGWTPEPVAATEDATYKAVFDSTLNSYQIAWQYVGGTLIGYTTVPYGEIPTHSDPEKTSAEPRKYTLTFSHWDPTPVAVTGPATYTAIFDTIYTMYTVNFYNYDSTLLQSTQYRYGENAEYTGATPTRPDDENYSYTFGGWDPELTWVWESRDYIAVFDKKINSVALTVKYPDFGVSLNSGRYYAASETQMTVTCANPDAYEFKGADFWLAEEGYHEYYDRILQPDSQYLVRFYMMPKEGFSFVGVENITVNGETPFDIDIKLYDKSMNFSMIFRTGDPLIDEVHVTLNYPKAGDAFHAIVEPEDPGFADLGAVPDTAHYQIVRYRFYTADGGEITDAETFEPGTEYLMMAQVEPYYLWTFPLTDVMRIVDFDLMKSITVNGATVAQDKLESNGNIIFISMPFTTTSTGMESVSGQSVTGKFLRDGVLFIEREGKTYNAQGARVK